jgi:hypothetical protein
MSEVEEYRQGWKMACQACMDMVIQESGYPYGPDNPPPTQMTLIFRLGKLLGRMSNLRDHPDWSIENESLE